MLLCPWDYPGRNTGACVSCSLLYLTVCDRVDCSPPGSSVHGIILAGILERALVAQSCIWLFATAWTVAHQAPLSMGFSRPEYWSGLPFPSPEDLPDPGSLLHCRQILYHWAVGEAILFTFFISNLFYLFLAVMCLRCCPGFLELRRVEAPLCCGAWASLCGGFSCCRAPTLGAQAPAAAAPGLWSTGSVVVAHGLSRSTACEIFPDQGSNPCLCLGRWSHQGNPHTFYLHIIKSYNTSFWLCVDDTLYFKKSK